MKKSIGTPFTTWLGVVNKISERRIPFLLLRDYYECGLTPEEVLIKVE